MKEQYVNEDFSWGPRQFKGKAVVARLGDAVQYVSYPDEIVDSLEVGQVIDLPGIKGGTYENDAKALVIDNATFALEVFKADLRFVDPDRDRHLGLISTP